MPIGKRIKDRRNELGWTQTTLAKRCNVNRVSVTNWENEEHTPDINNARNLTKALGLELDWLLEKKGSKYRQTGDPDRTATVGCLASDEMDILNQYRLLDTKKKKAAQAMMDVLHQLQS